MQYNYLNLTWARSDGYKGEKLILYFYDIYSVIELIDYLSITVSLLNKEKAIIKENARNFEEDFSCYNSYRKAKSITLTNG